MSDLGNKEIMAKNIQHYMDKNGISRNKLSDDIGISYTTVSDWINAKTYPRIDKIELLANYFNVEKSDLVEDSIKPSNITSISDFIDIPILGDIACGQPIFAEENVDGYRRVYGDNLPNGKLFFLKARGDSMTPSIPDGSYVLIREQPDVESGEIAAVLVNGDTEATLKKVRKLQSYVLLEALNEDYEPYIVNEDNPARIIGKAVKVEYDL